VCVYICTRTRARSCVCVCECSCIHYMHSCTRNNRTHPITWPSPKTGFRTVKSSEAVSALLSPAHKGRYKDVCARVKDRYTGVCVCVCTCALACVCIYTCHVYIENKCMFIQITNIPAHVCTYITYLIRMDTYRKDNYTVRLCWLPPNLAREIGKFFLHSQDACIEYYLLWVYCLYYKNLTDI
jgi:hypothetical protein